MHYEFSKLQIKIQMAENPVSSQIKIAVVDDHDLVRVGTEKILNDYGISHVEKFGSCSALMTRMDEGNSFDFYIIDLELPDIDGFELIEMIRARYPVARIIVITVHDEIWTLRKLLLHDVNAIIYKSYLGNEIVKAIEEILNGNNYYCEEVNKDIDRALDSSSHPSARELEVLYEIAKGKTSKEIAASMFVSDNTVEAHRKALFSKLGASNVADLIVKSIAKGYLNGK